MDDFLSIIDKNELHFCFVIVDKSNAELQKWHNKAILTKAYLKILEVFILNLIRDDFKGRITVESEPMQDFYLMKAHNSLKVTGIPGQFVSAKEYRKRITSLCFVEKSNLDIEVQVADMIAPIAGLIYRLKMARNIEFVSNIEQMKIDLVERKLSSGSEQCKYIVII